MEPTSKQLLEQLLEAHRSKTEQVPQGFRTREGWEREWRVSKSHAKNLLKAGIEKGIMVMKYYKVYVAEKVCSLPHYGPAPTSSGKQSRGK